MADDQTLEYATPRPRTRSRGRPYWVFAVITAAPAVLWTIGMFAFAAGQRDRSLSLFAFAAIVSLPAWLPALVCWGFHVQQKARRSSRSKQKLSVL